MSIIFTADLHIKHLIFSKSSEILGDAELGLQELTRLCLEDYGVTGDTALVLGGDLFDVKTPPAHIVRLFQDFVTDLKLNNVAVWGIQGNHELNRIEPWLSVLGIENLSHRKICPIICGHKVYGMDYLRPNDLVPALQAIPADTEILVLHQALHDALSFVSSAGDESWDFVKDDVPPFVRLTLIGDIHITDNYVNQTTLFAYPGSLFMQKMNEAPNKYVIKVNSQCGIEFVPIETRTIHQFKITTNEEALALYNMAAATKHTGKLKTVFEVTYFADVTEALIYVSRMLELEDIHVIAKPSHRSDTTVSEIPTVSVDGFSLHDFIPEFVDKEENPMASNFLRHLLTTGDVKAFLKDYREEIINGTKDTAF